MRFEAISGLRIILIKSFIHLIGTVDFGDELTLELRCQLGSLPADYLSLPLGSKIHSSSVRDSVEERLIKHLALWKRQYISKGGRLTPLKSPCLTCPPTSFRGFVSLRLCLEHGNEEGDRKSHYPFISFPCLN